MCGKQKLLRAAALTEPGERRTSKDAAKGYLVGYPIGELRQSAVPEMLGSAADEDDRRRPTSTP